MQTKGCQRVFIFKYFLNNLLLIVFVQKTLRNFAMKNKDLIGRKNTSNLLCSIPDFTVGFLNSFFPGASQVLTTLKPFLHEVL